MTADQGRLVILRSLKILRLDLVGEGCIRKVGQTHELCLSQWRGAVEISQPLEAKKGEVGLSNSQNVAHKLDPGM